MVIGKACHECGHPLEIPWSEAGPCDCYATQHILRGEDRPSCWHGPCIVTKLIRGRPMLENTAGYVSLFNWLEIRPHGMTVSASMLSHLVKEHLVDRLTRQPQLQNSNHKQRRN